MSSKSIQGISINSGNHWKLGYEYGEIDGNGNVDTAKNTGNVARQTLSFNGLTHPFVQTYKYDSLYRLTEARETSNGAQTWKQNFSFDRYGNRLTHDKFAGTTQLSLSVPEHPAIETATNRLSSGQGFTFDANGNLIIDADGRQFAFNGDNKQTEVKDAQNTVIGRYWYDGEGKRVKKVTATETTVFVYSAGKLIAEYSTATPPSNPTTSWTVTDQLGSPRVIVNSLGAVVSRRDFMPFGEELLPDETYRKTLHKYGQADSVRQKFTGYQNDTETGLDFAEARMYQNLHGRFTAVDPLLASGKSGNPQTFNRYVYVVNNPMKFIDPTGLQIATYSGSVWANEDETHFFSEPGEGRHEYFGRITRDRDDGFRYTVDRFGWRSIGRTEDLIEDDISDLQSAGIGLKRMANGFYNMPMPLGPTYNPNIPSFRELTGFQPFTDEETETKTWRDWSIATGTELAAGYAAGRGMGALGRTRFAASLTPRLFGSGPAAGVLEVSTRVKSVGAFTNYFPKTGSADFVFDVERSIFVVGRVKFGNPFLSPHENLAASIGSSRGTNIVGGSLSRGVNGEILTDEMSGHFWRNWTPANRERFVQFLRDQTGLPVRHSQ